MYVYVYLVAGRYMPLGIHEYVRLIVHAYDNVCHTSIWYNNNKNSLLKLLLLLLSQVSPQVVHVEEGTWYYVSPLSQTTFLLRVCLVISLPSTLLLIYRGMFCLVRL